MPAMPTAAKVAALATTASPDLSRPASLLPLTATQRAHQIEESSSLLAGENKQIEGVQYGAAAADAAIAMESTIVPPGLDLSSKQPRLRRPQRSSRRRTTDPFRAWRLAKQQAAEENNSASALIQESQVLNSRTPEQTLTLDIPAAPLRAASPEGLDIGALHAEVMKGSPMPLPGRGLRKRSYRNFGLAERDELPLEAHGLNVTAREEGANKAFKQLRKQRSWDLLDDDMKAAQSVFAAFDRDEDGLLSAQELKLLLREQGLELESLVDLQHAIELASGKGERGVDLDGFLGLVAYSQARRRGYSMDELKTLRHVFDAYDTNHSGALETSEYSTLLSDIGLVPRSRQESQDLADVVSQCCSTGLPGPLSFADFLVLAERIDKQDLGVSCNVGCEG
jgi:Ca2+-binding EF-hand superfamily protein